MRRTIVTRLVLAFSPLLINIHAASPAGGQDAKTYTNPVYAKDFPDPSVVAHEGKFYAYATETAGTGTFQLMESPDLVHWTPRKLDFLIPWAREHYWAPEVIKHRGTFVMTYSALDPETRKHHIAVATAENPAGPFRHRGFLVRGDDNKVGVIDATIFFEDDGTPFLIYSEETPRRVVLRRLKPDLLGTESEKTELIRPDRDWECGVTEAPTMVERDGIYHLFYSAGPFQAKKGDCQYKVAHATAKSLKGPYKKDEKPLLESVEGKVYGPGHQCLVKTPAGEYWMLYHGWDARNQPIYGQNPAGRTLRIDRLEWGGDTPRIEGPTTSPQPAPKIEASEGR